VSAFIINPGTGPIPRALLRHAWKNIRRFRRDFCKGATIQRLSRRHDYEGRYAFKLTVPRPGRRSKMVVVDTPGIPFVKSPLITAWPRLYVDGSSWAWRYAGPVTRRTLGLCSEAESDEMIARTRGVGP
jgi:hypothetical protein